MTTTYADIRFDQWASICHKAGLDPAQASPTQLPGWVPEPDRVRLLAYLILWSYTENVARAWSDSDRDRRERREYGDAQLLVSRVSAGVLGSTLEPQVDGAQKPPGKAPEPDVSDPGELPDGADDIDQQIHAVRRRVFDQRRAELAADWAEAWDRWPALRGCDEWVRAWWDVEHVDAKIVESEQRHTIPLGDGVLVLHASTGQQRPVLTVHPPDEYFPALDGLAHGEFPNVIHLASEEHPPGGGEALLHRTTYHLGPVLPERTEDGQLRYLDAAGTEVLHPAPTRIRLATVLPHHTDPTLRPVTAVDANGLGTRVDADGELVRVYPWGESDAQCYVTALTWRLGRVGEHVDALDDDEAETVQVTEDGEPMADLALPWDFLPVIHVPGMVASGEHFGRSILSRVLQLLDAIGDADLDLEYAAALAAGPVVFLPTESLPESVALEPGTMMTKGSGGGRVDHIDTAASLGPLGKHRDDLLERLEVVTEIGRAGMGRVTGDQVPSGVALRLSFTTFEQLIAFLRITRQMKYPLLLKMAWRMGQAMGWAPRDPATTPTMGVVFGRTTPTDVASTVEQLTALLQAKGISRVSAVAAVADLGFPVGDPVEEVARIVAEDYAGAKLLSEATDSAAAAADLLGIELVDEGGPEPSTSSPLPGPLDLDV